MKFFLVALFSMINKRKADDINTVLPVVEMDQRVLSLSDPGRSLSTHRCSPWYWRLLHCQDMVRTFLKISDIRLQEDELNAQAMSYMLALCTCMDSVVFLF